MTKVYKLNPVEVERLKRGFSSRAHSLFWVRMGFVGLNTFLIFRSEWLGDWPEAIQWLASLITLLTLAYSIVSLNFVESARFGRWVHFITLNLDVAWLICIIFLTG